LRQGARPRRASAIAAACLAVVVAPAVTRSTAVAQSVVGGFDDATTPRRGELRVRLMAEIASFTERFGTAGTTDTRPRGLGANFALDTIGAAQLPALGPLESALAAIVDGTPERVTLGRSTADARATTLVIPLRGEYGITRRLSLGITLPIVRTRQVIDLRVNPDGTTGNTGFNPAITDLFPSNASAVRDDARGRNALVQTQFAAAVTALERLLSTCPTQPGGTVPPGCAPILANRPAATALVTSATAFARGVARVYGTGADSAPGLAFVPVAGSALQQQVQRRLAALAEQFRGFGVSDIAATTAPAGSPARLAEGGLQRVLVDEQFGILADSLQSTLRSSLGDVDVEGSVLLVDTFGEGAARLTPSGFRARAVVGAGFRFGVAEGVDVPFVFFDLPTAGGANALLFRGAADVAFGRRAWASVSARLASPLADELLVRITEVPTQPFPEAVRERLVGRQLGRELELRVTPRYTLGDYLGVAAHYELRAKSEDRYTGTFEVDTTPGAPPGTVLDAATLGLGTATRQQRLGFGLTYSTVAAHARGRSNLPLEVSFLHTRAVAGRGGTPKSATDAVQVRLYFQLFGRSPARPAPATGAR
jgi:hypothetical protein